jgi:type I restriction-modification system DNA methylase subunit
VSAAQFRLNQQIEQFIADQDEARLPYSPDQLRYIAQYTGSGGMGSKGATGEGLLYEFYTPDYVCDLMWELARHYGFDDEKGHVLEPSCATGRLIRPAKHYNRCAGFEINDTSARIAELLCPGARIHRGYFETAFLSPTRFTQRYQAGGLRGMYARQANARMDALRKERLKAESKAKPAERQEPSAPTWLEQYPFDLVIGNPPYGIYQNLYSGYFPEAKRQGLKQIELFFMAKGLELLRPGGLLVYLTGANFLRNGQTYLTAKQYLATISDLIDAYRLPPVFDTSNVPTDILVFRRL